MKRLILVLSLKVLNPLLSDGLPPVPEDPSAREGDSDRRIWIGNLDTRLSEFTLLKLLQKYGTLERFDFLYHKKGPDEGKSRGYCFVSYKSRQEAEYAMGRLNGKLALSKRLVVRWAHKDDDRDGQPKPEKQIELQSDNLSAEGKIRAIERQLQLLEKSSIDISSTPAAPPGTSKLSQAHAKPQATDTRKPYFRKEQKR